MAPPLTFRLLTWMLACVALMVGSGSAFAQTAEQCVNAHEQSQVLRMGTRLLEAREQMRRCAAEDCPSVIRKDCLRWLEEISTQIPTVVLEAVDEGGAASNVKVYLNDKLLTERLTGGATELDPGNYEFRFELEGEEPKTIRVLLKQGDHNRSVTADFRPPARPVAPGTTIGGQPIPPPPVPTHRPVQPITYVLLGTTVLGGAGFAVFGSMGQSKKQELERPLDEGGCKPFCTEDEVNSVRTPFLIADISVAVGAASALGALITFLTRPEVPLKDEDEASDEKPPSEDEGGLRVRHFGLATTSSGAGFQLGGQF